MAQGLTWGTTQDRHFVFSFSHSAFSERRNPEQRRTGTLIFHFPTRPLPSAKTQPCGWVFRSWSSIASIPAINSAVSPRRPSRLRFCAFAVLFAADDRLAATRRQAACGSSLYRPFIFNITTQDRHFDFSFSHSVFSERKNAALRLGFSFLVTDCINSDDQFRCQSTPLRRILFCGPFSLPMSRLAATRRRVACGSLLYRPPI